MRLKWISLSSVLSLAVLSGCTASGTARQALLRDNDRSEVAIRDKQQYSPRDYDDSQEPGRPETSVPNPPGSRVPAGARENPEPDAKGEPTPAPPAFGISRVKSVSLLSDIRNRIQGKPASEEVEVPEECTADEEFEIGACSPIQSCAPEECGPPSPRVQKYRDEVCTTPGGHGSHSIRSIQKSFGKLFHRHSSHEEDRCIGEAREPRRSWPLPHDECCESDESPCAQDRAHRTRRIPLRDDACVDTDCLSESCGTDTESCGQQPLIAPNPKPRRESLADPLQEPLQDGRQSPGNRTPAQPPAVIPAAPAAPVPNNQIPGVPVPPAAVPQIPDGTGPSVRIVEPPAWPGNRGTLGPNELTRPATHYTPLPNSNGKLPLIVPGRRI
jgi:hypothetical protein